jgi:Zn-dependent peptidase ImmA (M78 family)/DNA-binding XRE family transcriptional regulator
MECPVTPEIVKYAREYSGLSLEDVAKKYGPTVTPQTIRDWENGNDRPTISELEKFANLTSRPTALFYFPAPPKEEPPQKSLRTLPEKMRTQLSPQLIKMLQRATALQLNLEELFDGLKPQDEILLDLFSSENIDLSPSLTSRIRTKLGVNLERQFEWKDPNVAFKNWRRALEAKGIWVFKDAYRDNDYSGFCLHSDKYPVIHINNSMPPTRQVFTLFHELGHLLYGSNGVDHLSKGWERSSDVPPKYRKIEQWCNAFAAELLVPNESLQESDFVALESNFELLSEKYSVSKEVILRKFLDRNLVTRDEYQAFSAKWIAKAKKEKVKKKEKGGGNYYSTKQAYLGERYGELLFARYYRDRINERELSEYLGVKESNIPDFEATFFAGGRS